MKSRSILLAFAAGALAGCMAAGPPIGAQSPSAPPSPAASARRGPPLILDRTDLRIGTTVHFSRVPTVSEVHDVAQLPGLAHLVLSLPEWPADFEPLRALDLTPPETQVIVVLSGYPPSQAAADLWSYVGATLRIVVVVTEPPPSPAEIGDLNTMRALERVIAEMDQPSRSGFERLQRPLSFRKVVD
ncbi:MAG: hypothetical protein ACRENJ_10670 [Candidatus Eiseniibacteriota bacterium]